MCACALLCMYSMCIYIYMFIHICVACARFHAVPYHIRNDTFNKAQQLIEGSLPTSLLRDSMECTTMIWLNFNTVWSIFKLIIRQGVSVSNGLYKKG